MNLKLYFFNFLKYDRDLGGYKDELAKVEKSIKANKMSCKQEETSLTALKFELQGAEKIAKSLGLDNICSPAQPQEHHPNMIPFSSTMLEPRRGNRSLLDSSGG